MKKLQNFINGQLVDSKSGQTSDLINPATGELTGITIVTGGSGYRPIPPTNTQAQLIISTGRVENIIYR